MMTNDDTENAKKCQIFICKICEFTCSKKSNYINHLATQKHKMMTNDDKMMTKKCQKMPNQFHCECGKVYKHRQGLSLHKKKCQKMPEHRNDAPVEVCQATTSKNHDDVEEFTQKDKRMMKMMTMAMRSTAEGIANSVKEIVSVAGTNHSHNTTNSHNKTFNLNFYLNETCKDAMNIQDFIKTLRLSTCDLERVGELGYTEGISRMFIKGLNELEVTKRPIHCSDLKREIIHIKDNDRWEQDNANRDKLRKAISDLSNKNIMLLDDWQRENPGYDRYDSKKNDIYLKIMVESMGPADEDTSERSFRKITRKVAVNTIIDKGVV